MPITILRWKGGSGGDAIMKLILLSNPSFKSNLEFQSNEVLDNGGTPIIINDTSYSTEVNKLAIGGSKIEKTLLLSELHSMIRSTDHYIIKSHNYGFTEMDSCTIDLVVNEEYLPFAVSSNLEKTDTLLVPYNKLVAMISDKNVASNYAMYNVARDISNTVYTGKFSVTLASLFESYESIKIAGLNELGRSFYNDWIAANTSRLPSEKYVYYVKNKDYNYSDSDLNICERYCLLALAGKKFITHL